MMASSASRSRTEDKFHMIRSKKKTIVVYEAEPEHFLVVVSGLYIAKIHHGRKSSSHKNIPNQRLSLPHTEGT